jgi:hypothetical protein
MSALAIRDDISSEELRREARRERDGRVSARLIAIANALEGMDRASAAAGRDGPPTFPRFHVVNGGHDRLCPAFEQRLYRSSRG